MAANKFKSLAKIVFHRLDSICQFLQLMNAAVFFQLYTEKKTLKAMDEKNLRSV